MTMMPIMPMLMLPMPMLMVLIIMMLRWYVEYQKNNDCVVIGETEPNQSVYLFKCENSTVQVKSSSTSSLL